MSRLVTKCVCKRITFSELKVLAEEKNFCSLDEILAEKIAGSGCGMCKPYINKMLVTGITEFKPGDFHLNGEAHS